MKRPILLLFVLFMISCVDKPKTEPKSDAKIERNPHGSVYIDIKFGHGTGFDLLTTTRTIHNENGIVIKTAVNVDTIPSLGMVKDTLATGRTHRDKDDNTIGIDTVIVHPKEYKSFITVKFDVNEKK
jgi:hypothetical protein